jgi:AraC family transcriptional regulator of adaptative response / DNA-3-methyladenine glycosylase II
VDATARIAQRAAGLIEDGALNEASVTALAERLAITDRHLRRVFHDEFGVSPIEYAQTHRLLLAKRLLTDTALSVTQIAMVSGFSSLRRFNALFRNRYRLSPTDLRKHIPAARTPELLIFHLGYRPPLDWPNLAAFLAKRSIDGVEASVGEQYWRTVRIVLGERSHTGWIAVGPVRRKPALEVHMSASLVGAIPTILSRVKRAFDLTCNPVEIEAALGKLAAPCPGLRLPGAFDGFEVAVRAVVGQQITVKAARTIVGRFATAFGDTIETPQASLRTLFPTPARISQLSYSEIAAHGILAARAKSIIALAQAIVAGRLLLEPGANVEATVDTLRQIPGVGVWTAQYIAMRALSWPDAFPHTDYGVLKAMGEVDPRAALHRARQWQPWRAYATVHLWQSLEARP